MSALSSSGHPVLRGVVVPAGGGALQPDRHPAGGIYPGPAWAEQEIQELRHRWAVCPRFPTSESALGPRAPMLRVLPSWTCRARVHFSSSLPVGDKTGATGVSLEAARHSQSGAPDTPGSALQLAVCLGCVVWVLGPLSPSVSPAPLLRCTSTFEYD